MFYREWEAWQKKRREREKHGGSHARREKPTESKMKEGDTGVGGRQGKTGEEREDAKDERARKKRGGGGENVG